MKGVSMDVPKTRLKITVQRIQESVDGLVRAVPNRSKKVTAELENINNQLNYLRRLMLEEAHYTLLLEREWRKHTKMVEDCLQAEEAHKNKQWE
jgi:hypothetical protein